MNFDSIWKARMIWTNEDTKAINRWSSLSKYFQPSDWNSGMHQLFRRKSVQRRYNRTFIELLLCARLCTKHLSILFNLNFVAILRSSCNSVTHTYREVQLWCTDLLLAALVLVALRPSLVQWAGAALFWSVEKPSTVWITISCGKFFKRWEHQTTWPASWETCMQVRKQQLELDREQQTGSK